MEFVESSTRRRVRVCANKLAISARAANGLALLPSLSGIADVGERPDSASYSRVADVGGPPYSPGYSRIAAGR